MENPYESGVMSRNCIRIAQAFTTQLHSDMTFGLTMVRIEIDVRRIVQVVYYYQDGLPLLEKYCLER